MKKFLGTLAGAIAASTFMFSTYGAAQAETTPGRYQCDLWHTIDVVMNDRAPLQVQTINKYVAVAESQDESIAFQEKFGGIVKTDPKNMTLKCVPISRYNDDEIKKFEIGKYFYEYDPYTTLKVTVRAAEELIPDWRPAPSAAEVKTLQLHFKPAFQTAGYKSAYIDLRYKFIVCAGEVQVAYSLDRKSLKSTDAYLVGDKLNLTPIINPPLPEAPMTVDLNAVVWLSGTMYRAVTEFRDPFAGESLGMGCFDGQTRAVGTIKDLFGSDVSPKQVKEYLAAMTLSAKTLPTILLNASIQSSAAERIKELERQKGAEEDAAEVARLAEEARQMEESKKRIAELQAKWDKTIAEYEANVAQSAAAKAEFDVKMQQNAQQRAEYEAAAAKYKADMEAYRARYPGGQ